MKVYQTNTYNTLTSQYYTLANTTDGADKKNYEAVDPDKTDSVNFNENSKLDSISHTSFQILTRTTQQTKNIEENISEVEQHSHSKNFLPQELQSIHSDNLDYSTLTYDNTIISSNGQTVADKNNLSPMKEILNISAIESKDLIEDPNLSLMLKNNDSNSEDLLSDTLFNTSSQDENSLLSCQKSKDEKTHSRYESEEIPSLHNSSERKEIVPKTPWRFHDFVQPIIKLWTWFIGLFS